MLGLEWVFSLDFGPAGVKRCDRPRALHRSMGNSEASDKFARAVQLPLTEQDPIQRLSAEAAQQSFWEKGGRADKYKEVEHGCACLFFTPTTFAFKVMYDSWKLASSLRVV